MTSAACPRERLGKSDIPTEGEPRWLNFSRDGRFAFSHSGEVVDTATKRVVAKTPNAKVRLQIDFKGGKPYQAYSRYGLGYRSPSASLQYGHGVSSFTLIDARTDQPIGELKNGATLDLAALGTRELSIQANSSSARTGSVSFELNGKGVRVDNGPLFTLAGDENRDYRAWTPVAGTHLLKATPYSGGDGTGTAGEALEIYFTVSN